MMSDIELTEWLDLKKEKIILFSCEMGACFATL
jgi:hypothetical protein